MKHFLILVLLSFLSTEVLGQSKNDFNWILGYPPNKPESYFGGAVLNFDNNSVAPEYFNTNCSCSGPAIISTSSGSLLAYSNGCSIYNSAHEILTNGDSISYGQIWENYCGFGYPSTQGQLFLPWPDDSSKAILFHIKVYDDFSSFPILYSVIKFNEDFNDGSVILKNQFLVDAGKTSLITATRHSNGRDWWIIIPEARSNNFYTVLLEPQGLSIKGKTALGAAWGPREWGSQAVFTPDGTKYIRMNPWKGIDIISFDRCTGELSDIKESGPLTQPVIEAGGVAVSANSKYLYISNSLYLFQFDLLAEDIFDSKQLIDTFDGFMDPFQTNFYQMALAPDDKIYVFSTSGVKSLGVINDPNKYGTECRFNQHQLHLPVHLNLGAVNMPYYRLGPDDGSVCDTLEIDNEPVAFFRYERDSVDFRKLNLINLSYFKPELFQWDFGDGTMSSARDPEFVIYDFNGTFNVCLHVSNQYGSDSFCQEVTITDTSVDVNHIGRDVFTLYPNPFNSTILIKYSALNPQFTFTLYSLLGSKVYQEIIEQQSKEFSLEHLASGIYIYTLSDKTRVLHSGKIIKGK